MNQRVEIARLLILDVLASFVDHRDRIAVVAQQAGGKAVFTVRVDDRDYGKVAGKQGTHIKALTYLVREVGDTTHDSSYRLVLVGNPMQSAVRPEKIPPARRYDPEASRQLLERFARSIAPEVIVRVAPGRPDPEYLVFMFTLEAQNLDDYDLLLAPYDDSIDGPTTTSALGTIWRAAGRRDGVIFRIQITRRATAPQTAP
jgi:predicted RNA-binding protein YlqC (UPF0109 family)